MGVDLEVLRSIRHLVAYASLAYHDGFEFQAYAEGHGLSGDPKARELSTQNIHVHLGIQNCNSLVMAFSGHNTPLVYEDYARLSLWYGLCSDISAILFYNSTELNWPWPGFEKAFVHTGFLLAFNGIVGNLVVNIRHLSEGKEPQKIEVCGHGFGGAVATLCALWCSLQWPAANVTCVTLGSPRVGDEIFAKIFEDRRIYCYRLVVDSDQFSTIPAGYMQNVAAPVGRVGRYGARAWQHVGKEILLRRSKAHEEEGLMVLLAAGLSTSLSGLWSTVERATNYVGVHWRIWGLYRLLRGLQMLWNILWDIQIYSITVYLRCFQRMLEGEEGSQR
ncbi:Alpha/Beta hydrolase protein [Fusarium oxysporum]|nr:Alpha/Beta hydrolase protein [Fusarium oxysporum]